MLGGEEDGGDVEVAVLVPVAVLVGTSMTVRVMLSVIPGVVAGGKTGTP